MVWSHRLTAYIYTLALRMKPIYKRHRKINVDRHKITIFVHFNLWKNVNILCVYLVD